jgi:hypothetical protein
MLPKNRFSVWARHGYKISAGALYPLLARSRKKGISQLDQETRWQVAAKGRDASRAATTMATVNTKATTSKIFDRSSLLGNRTEQLDTLCRETLGAERRREHSTTRCCALGSAASQ